MATDSSTPQDSASDSGALHLPLLEESLEYEAVEHKPTWRGWIHLGTLPLAIAAGIVARWTGGPMHQADRRGLLVLRRDLKVWAAEAPALYSPAPLLDRLIGEGRGFGA